MDDDTLGALSALAGLTIDRVTTASGRGRGRRLDRSAIPGGMDKGSGRSLLAVATRFMGFGRI
jgi:hypothetical protein